MLEIKKSFITTSNFRNVRKSYEEMIGRNLKKSFTTTSAIKHEEILHNIVRHLETLGNPMRQRHTLNISLYNNARL